MCQSEKFTNSNFVLREYMDSTAGKLPEYLLMRDGFSKEKPYIGMVLRKVETKIICSLGG